MRPGLPDHDTVLTAITLACRAPSVHNSQPWIWRIGDTALHLYADRTRHVPATDPDERDLTISCGAALHHLRVALAALGWGTVVHRLPNPEDPNHLASVTPHARQPSQDDISLVSAIPARRSDRRLYSSWPVPERLLERLTTTAAEEGCALRVATDAAARAELLRAIAEADRQQRDNPDYAAELAWWSGRGSTALDGVRSALSTAVRTGPDELRLREFRHPELPEPSGAYADVDAGVLVVVGTSGDGVVDRLRAGEATSAVLLRATGFQLASCLISQPVEVGRTRLDLRQRVLGGSMYPQLVIRLGWAHINADPLPASPRRPASEVVEQLES